MEDYNDKFDKIIKSSPFDFYGVDDRYIACVGENGNYDQSTIYDGFKDAVTLMINGIENNEAFADSIVYPLLYSVRHCIELFLKMVLENVRYLTAIKRHPKEYNELKTVINKISELKDKLQFEIDFLSDSERQDVESNLVALEKQKKDIETKIYTGIDLSNGGHNLNTLIELIEKSYSVDNRIEQLMQEVIPVLNPYRNIDPEGDMFKYLSDINGVPHFKSQNIQHVSLKKVQIQFDVMTGLFEAATEELDKIVREYQTGTFTKDLSRKQIEDISKELPTPKEYSERIKEVADSIKKRYNIGGNKFNMIKEMIDNHPEFAANHGKEIIIIEISERSLNLFAKAAFNVIEWGDAIKKISKDELSALIAFSEISGWRYVEKDLAYYSEMFMYLYKKNLERGLNEHTLKPQNEFDYVVAGMKKCGQITYENMLIQLKAQLKTETAS